MRACVVVDPKPVDWLLGANQSGARRPVHAKVEACVA